MRVLQQGVVFKAESEPSPDTFILDFQSPEL
jgi:hypothetical protein